MLMLQGFAERKVLLLLEVLQRCRDSRNEAHRQVKEGFQVPAVTNAAYSAAETRQRGLFEDRLSSQRRQKIKSGPLWAHSRTSTSHSARSRLLMQTTEARSSHPTVHHKHDPLLHAGQDESKGGIVVSPCS